MDNPASTTEHLTNRGLVIGGAPGETTQTVALFRLGEAWRALLAELRAMGQTPESILAGGVVTADDFADVVAQAAMRVLRNPDGASEESYSLDDYRESRKRDDTSQDVYFTAAELRRLTGSTAATVPLAGSLKYL